MIPVADGILISKAVFLPSTMLSNKSSNSLWVTSRTVRAFGDVICPPLSINFREILSSGSFCKG